MPGLLDRKIAPMLASSGKPFDSRDHLFEVKWDGIRTLAFFDQGRVRLQSRRLGDSTVRYPEVVEAVGKLPGNGVLDGEIVVLEGETPSFERVLEREQIRSAEKAALRARRHPASYIVFDLLHSNDRELLQEPLSRRKMLLSQLLTGHSSDCLVESTYVLERGRDLFKEIVERGLEGVVAKSLTSPYMPGKRSPYWIKVKSRRTLDCVVLGALLEQDSGRVKSLVLGAYRRRTLVWMGNVGSGLNTETLEQLAANLDRLEGSPPQGLALSRLGRIHWLRPALVARVQYLEATREGRLRNPVFVGFVDASPETCEIPERWGPSGEPVSIPERHSL